MRTRMENLGLTIRSNRQAVFDARACLKLARPTGPTGLPLHRNRGGLQSLPPLEERVPDLALSLMADDRRGGLERQLDPACQRALKLSFRHEDVRAASSIIREPCGRD